MVECLLIVERPEVRQAGTRQVEGVMASGLQSKLLLFDGPVY